MKRRTFLLAGLGTAGALVIGWGLRPPRPRLAGGAPVPQRDGDVALNGWLVLGRDGSTTVVVPKAEMGQGIHTALAMLLAEELDADWASVRVVHAPIDRLYGNIAVIVDALPFHPDDRGPLVRSVRWLTAKVAREAGIMTTGGSSSVADCWEPIRLAGATARAQLVATAARAWGVSPDACTTESGRVRHTDGRSIGYGELVAAYPVLDRPATVTYKDPARYRLIGTSVRRLEGDAKARGRAPFALDERPPGLRHAALRCCPVLGGRVRTVDATAARALPGVEAIVTVPPLHGGTGAVAVVAATHWHATRALDALRIEWDEGEAAAFSSADVTAALERALDGDDETTYRRVGDVDAALARAATVVEARYAFPYLAHATMEPPDCTVRVADGRADVWVGTQVPGIARDAVAAVLGLDAAAVTIHERLLGGGFGRRLETDFIAQAAIVAQARPGVPVSVLRSREDDIRHDFYRPASLVRCRAGLDAQGRLVGWQVRSASQPITHQYAARHFGIPVVGPDKTTAEGSFDVRYEVPALHVANVMRALPIPVGFWRGVGHTANAFVTECFIDELAHAARRDPLEFRRALLQRHPRQLAVLERVAAAAGWGTPVASAPDGAPVARGLAFHESFGTTVAQVAEVSLGPDRVPRVHRVTCVVDCGLAVNPGHIAQQIESSVIFGLSAALGGEITLDRGRVQQGNFDDYPMLRFPQAPAVTVHVMPSADPPTGLGEPGVPPIAPAVANAVFALTGERLRALPLRVGAGASA